MLRRGIVVTFKKYSMLFTVMNHFINLVEKYGKVDKIEYDRDHQKFNIEKMAQKWGTKNNAFV